MKKIWKYLIVFALVKLSPCKAQNLVLNPSFEDTVACPNFLGQVDRAVGWSSYNQTPDYFNSCAPFKPFPTVCVSVPENQWGTQYPRTGSAYVGLIAFSNGSANGRECIGIHLDQSTIIGQKYFGSLYVSRAARGAINLGCNKIGMRLTTIQYSDANRIPIDNYANIFTDSIIADTLNWVKISGSFTADSVYDYLSIGNFFRDSLTSYISYDVAGSTSIYYIDDICFSTDSTICNPLDVKSPELSNNFSLHVFPNPAHDWIEIQGNEIQSLALYDVLGRIVFLSSSDFVSSLRINTSTFSKGIYLLEAKTKSVSLTQKIIIN